MFFFDLIMVFLVALLFTAIFAAGFRKHRSRPGLIGFFLLLLLTTWAVFVWTPPFGWLIFGVAWAQLLLIGLLIALLMIAFVAPIPDSRTGQQKAEKNDHAALIVFDIFFWVLLFGLMVIILFGYYG